MPHILKALPLSLAANGLVLAFVAASFRPLWQPLCTCGDFTQQGRVEAILVYSLVTDRPRRRAESAATVQAERCPPNVPGTTDAGFRVDQMPTLARILPPGSRLCVRIDRAGRVTEVRFRGANPPKQGAAAMVAALRRTRFRPGWAKDRRVATWAEVRADERLTFR